MDRRTLIGAATAGMIYAPLAAVAQQAAKVRRIGVLSTDPAPTQTEITDEAAPLRALGWVEGKNLLVERRYTNGTTELLRPFAEELVRLKVEIIATLGTPATLAAKNATSTIPIVIWSAGDVVSTGVVPSLSRPGGNITGLSLLGPEVDAKSIALIRELIPQQGAPQRPAAIHHQHLSTPVGGVHFANQRVIFWTLDGGDPPAEGVAAAEAGKGRFRDL